MFSQKLFIKGIYGHLPAYKHGQSLIEMMVSPCVCVRNIRNLAWPSLFVSLCNSIFISYEVENHDESNNDQKLNNDQ
jgi:hypothetical protein